MSEITIEQFGGVVGPGTPGGHIHMRGTVAWSALSGDDQATINRVFAAKRPVNANVYYRLTRTTPKGIETVDAPGEAIPSLLLSTIRTVIE